MQTKPGLFQPQKNRLSSSLTWHLNLRIKWLSFADWISCWCPQQLRRIAVSFFSLKPRSLRPNKRVAIKASSKRIKSSCSNLVTGHVTYCARVTNEILLFRFIFAQDTFKENPTIETIHSKLWFLTDTLKKNPPCDKKKTRSTLTIIDIYFIKCPFWNCPKTEMETEIN